MDWQTIINIALSTVLAGIGWFANEIWSAMKELRRDVHLIEKELPEFYVRKEEFRDALREVKQDINSRFDKLEALMTVLMERLHDKADK